MSLNYPRNNRSTVFLNANPWAKLRIPLSPHQIGTQYGLFVSNNFTMCVIRDCAADGLLCFVLQSQDGLSPQQANEKGGGKSDKPNIPSGSCGGKGAPKGASGGESANTGGLVGACGICMDTIPKRRMNAGSEVASLKCKHLFHNKVSATH